MIRIMTLYQEVNLLHPSFWLDLSQQFGSSAVIVTDTTVASLFQNKIANLLPPGPFQASWIVIQPGESSKQRMTKQYVEDCLGRLGVNRQTVLIGLGGGVVTDLAGFVAANYLRGLRYVPIPTTLMGMVDAAIGGKNGLNTPYGKNLIGSFYPPEAVFLDPPLFLHTLPLTHIKSGLMEVLKHGIIASCDLFHDLETLVSEGLFIPKALLIAKLLPLIRLSMTIKRRVISVDFNERGERLTLNFGHRFAHALEVASSFTISHGEALAFGLRAESYLSHLLGHLSDPDLQQIESVLDRLEVSYTLPTHIKPEALIQVMQRDQKGGGESPQFVVIRQIGQVYSQSNSWRFPVDLGLIEQAMTYAADRQDACKTGAG